MNKYSIPTLKKLCRKYNMSTKTLGNDNKNKAQLINSLKYKMNKTTKNMKGGDEDMEYFKSIGLFQPFSDNTNLTNKYVNIIYNVSDDNLDSCWYSNDTMSVNTTLAGCVNVTDVVWSVGDHNVTVYVNDTAGNENGSTISFTMLADLDNDGLIDGNDRLLFNESNVNGSGFTRLNITVGGNRTNGTFAGQQHMKFYDEDTLIMNFSHNFSQADFDLSNVTII